MHRPRRRPRGIPTVLVAVFLAFVAIQLIGAPNAAAAGTAVSGQVSCASDGSYTVVWSVMNTDADGETATVTGFQPSGASVDGSAATIAGGASAQFTESGIDGTSTGATLTVNDVADSGGAATVATGTVTLDGACARPEHTAAAPTGADADCTSHPQPVITIPADSGVVYSLDGKTESAGTYPVTPGSHTVTASSATLTLDAPTSFSFDLHAATGCTASVAPVSPTISVPDCSSGTPAAPGLTLATTSGITYTVSAPAPYSPGQTVIVTATAAVGDSFDSPAAFGWIYIDPSHEKYDVTFPATSGCVAAVPVVPTFTDDVCVDFHPAGPTYTIPSIVGVDYVVQGVVESPGRYAATDGSTVTVRTRAQTGYVLSSAVTFTHRFTPTPVCDKRITARAPSFSPTTCKSAPETSAPTYSVPSVPGVVYSVNGVLAAAGTYVDRASSSITIVASPKPGYLLVGTTTWSHNYRQSTCPVSVVATAIRFTNSTCTSAAASGSYWVPRTTGVEYRIHGAVVAPGRHQVAGLETVTVTAHAQPGYVLTGQASFTHVFRARSTSCHGTGHDRGHRSSPDSNRGAPITSPASASTSPGLASTGSPIQELLLAGVVLLLMGAASHVGAVVRRRGPAQLFDTRQ